MYCIILAIKLTFFMSYTFSINIKDVEKFQQNLMVLTNEILSNYFTEHRCITLITEKELFRNFKPDISVTVMHVSSQLKDKSCDQNMKNNLVEGFVHNCSGYVIQLSDPVCFLNTWLSALELTINRHVPKFLFLPASLETNKYVDNLFSNEQSDVTAYSVAAEIDLNHTDWPITLWTNDFSLPAGTPGRENIFLDKWTINNGFLYNNQLYYDKIFNLNGREIKLITFNYPTYSVIENDRLEGTEGRMIVEFCRIHKCTYSAIDDGKMWGTLDISNGTNEGILGMVHGRKADLGYVGLYQWIDVNFFADYSTSWLHGSVRLLVPKPAPLNPWRTPFLPFDLSIWLIIVFSVIFSTLSFFAASSLVRKLFGSLSHISTIGKLERLRRTAMAVFGVIVLQSPPRYLILNFSSIRILFISTEILALILTSVYAAELASYLTVPQFTKPIDTVRELADSDLTWLGMHEAWVYSLLESEEEVALQVASKFKVVGDMSLEEFEKGIYGLGVEILPGGSMSEIKYVTETTLQNMHLMKEDLYGSHISLLFNKASPFRQHFNHLISRLLETGIILFWEDEVARKYFLTRIQLAFQEARGINKKSTPKKLTSDHVQGIFFLFAIGIFCALVSFIYEIFTFNRDRKSNTK